MPVVRHRDPAAFLAVALPLVAGRDADAALLRALAAGIAGQRPDERFYLATFAGSGGRGAAAQRADGPVVLANSEGEAPAAFADDLAADYPALRGVTGVEAACVAFGERWRERTGGDCRVRLRLRNHVLHRLVVPRAAPGRPRAGTDDDRAWLADMQKAFVADARLPDSDASALRTVAERLAAGAIRIWEDGARVAWVAFVDAGPGAARITTVYTVREQRGRGYAGALVAAVCAELQQAGRQVFLVTDLANATANALYARIGFVPLNDFVTADLGGAR